MKIPSTFLAATTVAYINSCFCLVFKQAITSRRVPKHALFRTRYITTRSSVMASSGLASTPQHLELISSIYGNESNSRNVFSLYVTGGGVQSLTWLLSVPGARYSILTVVLLSSRY